MRLVWAQNGWEDYLYWQESDRAVVLKINALIKDAKRSPLKVLGKSEPLKGSLKGWWSRRITGEHRFVYRVNGSGEAQSLEIAACRYHY
ncbi:Txe/YoeB family addiction module toxin [Rhizobiales bacterium]|uniref:Txe/YoeB family addiction module toxin n=1 Tax=Hongsoonwoonella zoysiae TaxID=2821844 RepID=UPI0015617AD1|nr:Txe/YoeB family addiction module toxin [Hongsoonwoonella zoysiae]NRG17357.1 Txe/YoeB family addiction module toxin [Hongsoonwoonella zoysiae]